MMRTGFVIIGRNEGERLKRCLASLDAGDAPVVYVDSGSTDGSVDHARSTGAHVVELDTTVPFTAARARNAGRERLRELDPALDAMQVLDGDCELAPGWLASAATELETDSAIAVVAGRRRERHPERSIYNRLCDREWALPPGDSTYFGGDALIRLAPFDQAGGYDPKVIAGEEPDLAWRMRQAAGRIRVIDEHMTTHDAAMTRFAQWWRRAVRAGHAHIAMAARHGWRVTPYNPRGVITTLAWSLALPASAIVLAGVVHPLWALLILIYPAQWARLFIRERRAHRDTALAAARAFFMLLAKWPETQGYATWALRALRGRDDTIIEYKSAGA